MAPPRKGDIYIGPRRHPAHCAPVQVHNRPVILHVTVYVVDNRPILANEVIHQTLRSVWQEADHWIVGTYMIMPEHVHFFCAPGTHDYPSVRHWAGYWKRLAGQRRPELTSAWLKDCWDTQMRDVEHYERRLGYVRRNPVWRGLVRRSEDWPYQGTLTPINWISG